MTSQSNDNHLVGIISDTHGLLRSEVVETFEGAKLIIHAGDIGKPEILEALRTVAPVVAVRGNMDWGQWSRGLPETQVVEIGGVLVYVLHDANKLDLEPSSAGFSLVISGHTHSPCAEKRNGVLFLNPGTAGPTKSTGSVALLSVRGGSLDTRFVQLNPK